MISALEALGKLRDGNRRFVANVRSMEAILSHLRRADLVKEQAPHSVVLGCSDSRAPAEVIFDQGLGDLFVIRVAGNVVAPSGVGSVEFATERFDTRLVVVMGHTHCGAIDATVESLLTPGAGMTSNLMSIVSRIRPAVEGLMNTELAQERGALLRAAVRANVRVAVNQLRHGSELLERRVARGELLIVGAEYDIETGKVDFFEGASVAAPTWAG